jgi:prephenate dehydrogenase
LKGSGWVVSGVDVDEKRTARALELGVVDEVGDDPHASIVFVATPVAAIADVARAVLESRGGDAGLVVTDVGGVKAQVVGAISDARFVGGHPMAGSEQEGPDGADPNLFVGATWVLTPTELMSGDAYQRVRSVVTSFGADVV